MKFKIVIAVLLCVFGTSTWSRLYIPKQGVQVYKDNGITGQQLIDRSVVVLNGERIDLKLQ